MAIGDADGGKKAATISERCWSSRRGSGGRGLVQELHERIEQPGITGDGGGGGAIGMRNVPRVGDASEVQAVGPKAASQLGLTRQRPIVFKKFVGECHFHVLVVTR